MSYNLHLNGVQTICSVTDSHIKYEKQEKGGHVEVTIDLLDIIAVEESQPTKNTDQPVIKLYFIQKAKSPKWSKDLVQFQGEPDIRSAFVADVNKRLEKIEQRPKNLLVIVNPVGGAKNGRNVHKNILDPLFKLARINTDVIFTERPRHVSDILNGYDISKIDGLVVCGGDGTYQECVDTLFKRTQNEAGIDLNNPVVEHKAIAIPIGIIPTGTGNGLAFGCYGCHDHETAVLHIIRGQTRKRMIGGAYCENQLVCYFGLLVAYGLFSNLRSASVDKSTWMSGVRNAFLPLFHLLIKKYPEINLKVTTYYKEYRSNKDSTDPPGFTEEKTEVVEGQFTNLFLFNGDILGDDNTMCMDYDPSEQNERLYRSSLLFFKNCSKLSMLGFVANMVRKSPTALQKDFLKCMRVTGFDVKVNDYPTNEVASEATGQQFNLNLDVDGEVVDIAKPEFKIRLFFDAVSLFGR